MNDSSLVKVGLVGAGGWARGYHLRWILAQQGTTRITAVCEPSPEAYAATVELFHAAELDPPPNQPDFEKFLAEYAADLDAALITTPHALHHAQSCACLEAGLHVLVEKPMVMDAAEARSLIEARDKSGKHLVVSFQGSLSPQIRKADELLRGGELGDLLSVSATIWQGWRAATVDKWRQEPEVAGGGMLFDTGAHMMNTVADLVGEDFAEVTAFIDRRGTSVDVNAVITARTVSGVMVTMHACGDTIPTCKSEIYVYCTRGILRTGAWGEKLDLQRHGRKTLRKVQVEEYKGAWQRFLSVLRGEIENPSPPEVGLRMARLWDAINASAEKNGAPVRLD